MLTGEPSGDQPATHANAYAAHEHTRTPAVPGASAERPIAPRSTLRPAWGASAFAWRLLALAGSIFSTVFVCMGAVAQSTVGYVTPCATEDFQLCDHTAYYPELIRLAWLTGIVGVGSVVVGIVHLRCRSAKTGLAWGLLIVAALICCAITARHTHDVSTLLY